MEKPDSQSTTDIFVQMEQQHQEFLRRIADAPTVDLFGIVSAAGAGGAKGGTGSNWNLVFHFDGWRQGGGPVDPGKLRVEMVVSKDELSSHMARINSYDMLHVKGQVADHPAGRKQALVQGIVSHDVSDAELEARAQELQEPVVVEDSRLGKFVLDRSLNWFVGRPLWGGKQVRLNLSIDEGDTIERTLVVATQLWDSEVEWNTKVIECVIQDLLPLKNDAWLEEGETELNADHFRMRIQLESITVYPDGAFEFWYDDGDLFLGHSIMVGGSLDGDLDGAGIHG
jgi:hypothetical protein